MKKLLLSSLLTSLAISASAAIGDTFEINNFIYTVTDDIDMTVSVKFDPYSDDDCPSKIVIPSKVSDSNNQEYTVTSVAERAFRSRNGIKSVSLPSTVTSIGSSAFSLCTSLNEINIPVGVTEIADYLFYDCTSLKSISLPASITKIGDSAFSCCTVLSSLTLPPALKEIANYALSSCPAFTTITLPASVTKVGVGVFDNDSNITTIYCMAVEPPTAGFDLGFDENENYPTLYVPSGTIDAYKAAKAWKNFPDVRELAGVVVSLSKTEIELGEGDEDYLQSTINGADGLTIVSETWSSSNPGVVVVDEDGFISALSAGEAVITYTVVVEENEAEVPYSASCKVTVKETYVEEPEIEIYITPFSSEIEVGETVNLEADVLNYSDATLAKYTWTSSDPAIATVEGNEEKAVVTAIKAGESTITLTVIAKVGTKQFKFENIAKVTVEGGQLQNVEIKNLTVTVKGQSEMTYNVIAGQPVTIALEPAEGFKVSAVTFNDESVTVVNNSFTTPEVNADSNIYVEYAWDGDIAFEYLSGVETVKGCDFRVYRQNEFIVIENVETSSLINVFDLSGVKLASSLSDVDSDIVKIRIVPGIYIITINGVAIKVNL